MVRRAYILLATFLAAAGIIAFGACGGTPLAGGSGGSPGSDGSPCATAGGCLKGSGGVSAVAGASGAGGLGAMGGAPGTGGIDAMLCDQIATAYGQAVVASYSCTPGAPNQCQALVAAMATSCPNVVCGIEVYVNDGTQVEGVRQQWLSACEVGAPPACPAFACDPPPPATCLPTSPGATTGACVTYRSDAGAATAPDGGESCNQLVANYQAAVAAAQACTPGAPNQCQGYALQAVSNSSVPTNCQAVAPVNDPSGVNLAMQRWYAQCYVPGPVLLIACNPLTFATSCVPNVDAGVDGGQAGICVVATPN